MLILKTVLLWIVFILLIVLEISNDAVFNLGVFFRLTPSLLLAIWFIVHIANRQRYQYKKDVSKITILVLSVFKTTANATIICGAALKIGHLEYSQILIIIGIGFLALWSTILIGVYEEKGIYNPEIIDDVQEDL